MENNRRTEIIEASIDLFNIKGLDMTSMADIAQKAGLAKATLYFYYRSKAELIEDVYRYCTNKNVDALHKGIEDTMTSIEKLCVRFANVIEYMLDHPKESFVEILYNSSPVYGDPDSHLLPVYYAEVEEMIKEGIRKGEIREQSSWILSTAYYGFASEMYLRFRSEPSLWNKETTDECLEIIRSFLKA